VLPDAAATVAFGTRLRAEAGEVLTGLEFFCDLGLDLALRHVPALTYPLQTRGGFYLLVEVASASDRMPLEEILTGVLEWGMEEGLVLDGTIAASQAQRSAFWRLREEQPEGQRLEGAQLKHDVAVPPGRIAEFVETAGALCDGILPGVRINPFGHLADGNIHYNLSSPLGAAGFGDRAQDLGLAVAKLATEMGGSFAAEHGLGQAKVGLADVLRSPVERRLMLTLRRAFDPGATLNPWAVVPADAA
jgi:FAD/FMN-containing dehydrogenase